MNICNKYEIFKAYNHLCRLPLRHYFENVPSVFKVHRRRSGGTVKYAVHLPTSRVKYTYIVSLSGYDLHNRV